MMCKLFDVQMCRCADVQMKKLKGIVSYDDPFFLVFLCLLRAFVPDSYRGLWQNSTVKSFNSRQTFHATINKCILAQCRFHEKSFCFYFFLLFR
jgi:hypothetical protein